MNTHVRRSLFDAVSFAAMMFVAALVVFIAFFAMIALADSYGQTPEHVHLFPIRWWPNEIIDPGAFANVREASSIDDSTSVWMQKIFEPTEIACPDIAFGVPSLSNQPVADPHDSATSISVWLRATDTVTVAILFGEFTPNNTGTIRTLEGPFDWQKVTVPLIGGEKTALYYCVTIPYLDASNKYENQYNAKVYVGPVTLELQAAADVSNDAAAEEAERVVPRARWYTFPLCQYTGFYGTLHEAELRLPKGVHYITSDGKQYVLGR